MDEPRGVHAREPLHKGHGLWLELSDRPFKLTARLGPDEPLCVDISFEVLDNLPMYMNGIEERLRVTKMLDLEAAEHPDDPRAHRGLGQ